MCVRARNAACCGSMATTRAPSSAMATLQMPMFAPASTKSAAEVSKTVEGEMDAIAQKYIAGEMGGKKKTGGIFGFGSKKK